ncbi:MAG: transposase [Chthoniobacteraceae bacterium]
MEKLHTSYRVGALADALEVSRSGFYSHLQKPERPRRVRDLAAITPEATHVLVRDQAGFHLRDGDPRLPAQVRVIDLPPYCPELNPCEQLWDILKDDIANQVFPSIQKLRAGMKDTLRRYWKSASTVPSLIGRDWFTAQLNASPKSQLSS